MRRVEVQWLDASSDVRGWTPIEDLKAEATTGRLICMSVGYLLDESDHSLLLIQSKWVKGGEADGAFQIPKSCVVEVKDLNP